MSETTEILRLLEPSDYEFYRNIERPPEGWPPRDVCSSLDKAHDNLRKLVRENDNLRAALVKMHRGCRLQLRCFLVALGLTWTALGWALSLLIPYAVHGMAK